MSELKQDRCPLCGGSNECGLAAGKSECWCFEAKIAPEVLERVPEEGKGKVCVCRKCAVASHSTRPETEIMLKGPPIHE